MQKQATIEARSTPIFRNTPEPLRYFYHPDHIGSTSWVTDSAKNGIQYCEYLPYGEPFLDQRSTTWNSRYTFSGKERDNETGYSYFGARYYNSDLSIWLSVDPLSDKSPGWSPYNYCYNNPIRITDPDGREGEDNLDWIKNIKTGQYEWNDNVTSAENTPVGYKYIGKNDNDILTDLNLDSRNQNQSVKRFAGGFAGDHTTGKAAPMYAKSEVTGTLNVSAVVSYNPENRTSTNAAGKTFEGVKFEAYLIALNMGTNDDAKLNYKGALGITVDGKTTYSPLRAPTSSYCIPAGSTISSASVMYPASSITSGMNFQTATISTGAPNPNLQFNARPIKINFNLMKYSLIK